MSDDKELNKKQEETESLSEKDLQQTTGGSGSLIAGGIREIKSGTLTEEELAKAVGGAYNGNFKLDGITSEVPVVKHKDWVEIA
jgi:hypothetical protein